MLSKGDLLALRQCPRRLWLARHRPELADCSESDQQLHLRYGKIAGEYARAALGNDLVWPTTDDDVQTRAHNTWQLLQQHPHRPGVETAFLRDELYCRADAVVRSNGHYRLQETKASTFPLKKDKVTPKEPKPHHLEDAAIQLWAAQTSDLSVREVELNLLNNQFVYQGDGNYVGLFRALDVSEEANALLTEIPNWIVQANDVLNGGFPACQTGKHCDEPYACSFITHCKSLEPAPVAHPLTLLPDNAGKKLAKKLNDEGYVSLLDVPADKLTGADSDLYMRIQRAHQMDAAIVEPGAAAILSGHSYPRYFLDFEGINLPVPKWAGIRPYQQVAFQWSCQIERQPGVIEHAAFLDTSGNDPSLACIEALLQTISARDGGPIYVYNATYEKGQLQALAERYQSHAEPLLAFVERLVDLLPLVKDHYYHPAMRGTFTLKRVLPCIAPDLHYGGLQEVQHGVGAQDAYFDIVFGASMTDEEKEQHRSNLRAYCKQDTWAMVELAYFLEGRGRPTMP